MSTPFKISKRLFASEYFSHQPYILYPNTKRKEDNFVNDCKRIKILSPAKGRIIPLSEVDDIAFSSEILGKGCAIIPFEGKIYSPVKGVVEAVPSSHHAVALRSDDGCSVLIHVGKDTVSLGGKYFASYVSVGDRVNAGDLLLVFDSEKLSEEGYDIKTPILIQDPDKYDSVIPESFGITDVSDPLFLLERI